MASDIDDLKVVLLAMSAVLHRLGWAIVALAASDGERVLIQKFNGISDETIATVFGPDGGETVQ